MRNRAFTLIELLVVISIIAILTAVATVSYSGIRYRSRDAQRINDLNQLKIALSAYYGAQVPQSYPSSASKTTLTGSDSISTALSPNYIRVIPTDPLNTGNYVYKYMSQNSAKNFTLYGTLENTNNSKGWGGGNQWVADGLQVTDS